ncbi:hypothetical protein EYF80_014804 [Liparis tanakae]|uniref:Uncharacterized protein n=1 Tax=Liparis tanakae TaxID=230148 RepID=A0A4Z2IAN6_9TELE|nr:hypothetical protein EYF80_014804 [Liparis tanakae]
MFSKSLNSLYCVYKYGDKVLSENAAATKLAARAEAPDILVSGRGARRTRRSVLSSSVGVTGLGLHPESGRPEPAAGADPLTHFLCAAPAHCQEEPLVQGKKRGEREGGGREGGEGEFRG